MNYIRVFTDDATFSPSTYSLLITPWELTAAKMTIELNGDHGEKAYPDYPEGSYFRFKDKFCPKITVESASGHKVANCPVTLYWESGSWNEHTGNKRRTVTGYTNSSGEVTLVLEEPNLPTSLGSHSVYLPGPQQYTHY